MSATNNIPLGRLDYDTREEICRRLRDRQSGRQINAWLSTKGAGPYRDQNFTNFRKTHYTEWLQQQTGLDKIRSTAEETRRKLEAGGFSILDQEIFDVTSALQDTDPVSRARAIAALKMSVVAAGRLELDRDRKEIAADAQALDREKFEQKTCELFLQWYADERARKIAESNTTNGEKIAALRQAYFADVEALDKSGAVKLPE